MVGQAPVPVIPPPVAVPESTCEESKTTGKNQSKHVEIHLDSGEQTHSERWEVGTHIMVIIVNSRVIPGMTDRGCPGGS
jgi:hypothetical protein